jgi:nucleoside-diphosphate-sugar epimerase
VNVLVTGASGFIGSALCAHFAALGHAVVPVVRRHSDLPNARIVGDEDDARWSAALNGCDSIVHLAGRAHAMREEADPLRALRIANVDATLMLARRAVAAGVRRFVFMSTIKVNGEHTKLGSCFEPNDEPAPEDAYALSKWEAEQGLVNIARETGLEVVIIRPPLVYGPGVKGNFAALIGLVKKGIPLPLGALDNQRSMIALDNLNSFIALCADRAISPQATNQVFLVSDGKAVSTTELLKQIALAHGRQPSLFPVPMGLIRFFARLIGKTSMIDRLLGSLVVNDSKAREMLGWQPPITMDEQLRRMSCATSS